MECLIYLQHQKPKWIKVENVVTQENSVMMTECDQNILHSLSPNAYWCYGLKL